MAEDMRTKRPWKRLSALLALAAFGLSGCGMYPSHPGNWPKGIWGDALKFVSHVIDFFAHLLWGNYGLALLVVTILVRLLILPLMVKQIRYSKMMQQLQPRIAEIRERHKGDNQKIQAETMKLWQEHGVNPMAGCLPMLVQLPILYALFGAIEGNVNLNHSTFLWIFHLGQPDHYFILPVVAAITTYLSSRVMMTGTDTQTKAMLYIMPVTVLIIGSRFASGLALYWIYSNLFTTVQTYFIRVRPARAGSNDQQGKPNNAEKRGKPANDNLKIAPSDKGDAGDKASKPARRGSSK